MLAVRIVPDWVSEPFRLPMSFDFETGAATEGMHPLPR